MGQKIKFLWNSCKNYVRLQDNSVYELRPYEQVYVFKIYSVKKILANSDSLNDILYSGFNLVYNKDDTKKIPLSIEYVQDYETIQKNKKQKLIEELESYKNLNDKENENQKYHLEYLRNQIDDEKSFDSIYIYRKINHKDIPEFYEFSSEIEIKGVRVDYWNSFSSTIYIYIDEPRNTELHFLYDRLFGNPQYYFKETPGERLEVRNRYYKIPISEIDKIIGVKRNFIIASFNQKEYEYSGEVKEYVLDLHQFDEKTYQILKGYNFIEMENTPDKKEEIKQTWWQKIFGK